MTRMLFTLSPIERDALYKLARRERRTPDDQVRYIIVKTLEIGGLLPIEDPEIQHPTKFAIRITEESTNACR